MATRDVKVLGAWPSPYVNRVLLSFKLKSIDFEIIEMNPKEKSELLGKYNSIYKKIPVLIHEEKPICESLNIVEYIDEAWPNNAPSIMPSDPYERAIARFWAAYVDDKWFPLFTQLREAKEDRVRSEEIMEKISEGLVWLEEAFINCSKGKAFFGGDVVGLLDIALGSHLGWLKVTENLTGTKLLDGDKSPRLVEWAERLYSDSSVKDVMLDPQILLEIFKKFNSKTSPSSD